MDRELHLGMGVCELGVDGMDRYSGCAKAQPCKALGVEMRLGLWGTTGYARGCQ